MQRPIQGMTGNDKQILRLLKESELALRVGDIQYNLEWRYDIEIPESTLYRRLSTMDYAGLLDLVDDDPARYAVSDLGDKHVSGQLTDQESKSVEAAYDEYDHY